MRILHVDDDPYWSALLHKYQRVMKGWEVIYATSVSEAISAVENSTESFDAILLDVMMPAADPIPVEESENGQKTGLLLARHLEARSRKETCIILLTARQNLEKFSEGESVVAGYISKIHRPEKICEEVQTILRAFRSPRRPSRGPRAHAG